MNLKINREPVRSLEKICDCAQEQSVELDYVLPDYYPEIFRIIKCTAEPRVTSSTISGDRITYELTVCIKVIYCTEGGTKPESVEQKLTYSRTVNLDSAADTPAVYFKAFADHMSCRAVNPRRVDIRGAVTVQICAAGERETEVISEVFGGNVQLKKLTKPCPSGIIRAQKRVVVSDEFELGDAPPVGSILRASAEIVSSDKKIIADKLAAKGELKISMLYTPYGSDGDSPVCTMQFSMPYSQLIALEGMDDSYECRVGAEVVSCDITPHSSGDGESHGVECEVMLFIDCAAVKMSMYEIASDEYSTEFVSSHTCVPVKIEKMSAPVDSTMIVRGICENKDCPLSVVYDAWCCTDRLHTQVNNGAVLVTGNVRMFIIGKAENGDFTVCESDVPVEETVSAGAGLDMRELSDEADVHIMFSAVSCSYTISSENKAEIKAEIAVRGWVSDCDTIDALVEISVDELSPRDKNDEYALRLYFAENGEEIWDIAKKYGASISRVMEENEMDSEVVGDGRMLLIPVE